VDHATREGRQAGRLIYPIFTPFLTSFSNESWLEKLPRLTGLHTPIFHCMHLNYI
jgi:hypothetical protein